MDHAVDQLRDTLRWDTAARRVAGLDPLGERTVAEREELACVLREFLVDQRFGCGHIGDQTTLRYFAHVDLDRLADRAPERRLAPAHDAYERYELLRWLSFIGTELHKKTLAVIFTPDAPEPVKDFARGAVHKPLAVLEAELSGRETLLGGEFSVADAYLFWALTLMPHADIPLDRYPVLRSYQKRHSARPAVQAALAFESEQHKRPFAA